MDKPKFIKGALVTLKTDDAAEKTIYATIKCEKAELERGKVGLLYTLSPENGGDNRTAWQDELTLHKLPVKVSFDSVIMDDWKREAILDTLSQSDNYDKIFDEWGFDQILEKGKAISMLFHGPPGTGKTLVAQAIADKLDRKLKVVSTAEVESSEPGGAERAIKAFFEAAQKDNLVLLFDECDSLIFDRTSVGAILGAQVNCLLGCLENFEGVVLFTTNRLGTLDEAMNRRISLKLEFPMPNIENRVKIWKRMFPEQCPLEPNINWNLLASVEITGGYIKNVVLRAARMAANKKLEMITNDLLVEALELEIDSMEEFEAARAGTPMPARPMGPGISRTAGRGLEIKRDVTKEASNG